MDFKLNMGELEEVLTSLHKMKASLETLDSVLVNVQDAVGKQKGKLADALSMEFGAHRDDISRQRGTVTKLYMYLESYVSDLKSIDSPTYRNRDMLVDAQGLQRLAETQRDILDHAKSDVFRVPQPSIGALPDDPDELWVMRHNQGLMEDLDDYLRQKLTQLQQVEGEAMHRISQDMRGLMEMDHAHATEIEKDYRQYDRNKVRQIGASTRDSIFGFGKRAIESLKHPEKQLESIAMLMKNLRSDPSGTIGMLWNGVVASYLEPYKKGDAYGLASSTIFFASAFGVTKGMNDFARIREVRAIGPDGNATLNAGRAAGIVDGLKIIDGKIGGKIPVQDFQEIRKASVHNTNGDSMTLGKYTPTVEDGVENWGKAGPDSYIGRAGDDSMYFDLGSKWSEIQGKYKLTDNEMFEYFNVPALSDAVKSGKVIRFSHKPDLKEYEASYLAKEWQYLQNEYGFDELTLEGDVWIASK
ncbi:hypothetical protein [Listeria booriae]|uniref:hypothetical protein n=1 Tax=Listeria booriae TaxID=1552123 RepID=UPI001C8B81D1|nr:hypothetical protein [Listeria booriae]